MDIDQHTMIPSKRAINTICEITKLERDLGEFLVEELIGSGNLTEILQDEEKMATQIGEHLVK